jgi:hypothetical protein
MNRVFSKTFGVISVVLVYFFFLTSCAVDDDSDGFPGAILSAKYTVFAWNDLGMHCLNPTYDKAVILPPYNTVWVQIVERGMPPKIVTADLVVEYRIVDNTSSSDKRSYGQFWDNAEPLFGAKGLVKDTGLNLVDPAIHNGLTGTMVAKGNHFQADGIPLVPVDDSDVWNPYQQIEITVKDSGPGGKVLATTRAMVPTSDEINCAKCHGTGGVDYVDSAFTDILVDHDAAEGTTLSADIPVLCASCHGSPALGTSGPGSSTLYLSKAIHGFHSSKGATCYDCHPGSISKCSRSLAHTDTDGNCTSCHGNLSEVAASIVGTTNPGGRVPWAEEPTCGSCHEASSKIPEVDTGSVLYRNASGHGGVSCAACHGSPHAMVPSSESNDNYQARQYQGKALSIGSCAVCHGTSHGEGFGDFYDEHGEGTEGESSACKVCHTGFSFDAKSADAPHGFKWRSR